MNKILWIFMAFAAGAFLPVQAGLNMKLGKAAGNPIQGSMISFLVGLTALLAYILITRQSLSIEGLKSAPAHVWLGGLLGAFYVTVVILAYPHLGPSLTFGLIVAGQMIISALMEHFNLLVANPTPINFYKIIGLALIVVGVIIVRKF